jgi:hypothetical protein
MVIIDVVFSLCSFLDKGVRSRHRNVICDPDLRILAPPDLNLGLGAFFTYLSWNFGNHILCIDDVECFGRFTGQTFEDNVVFLRVVDLDDVNDLVLVGNLEWEVYLA